MLEAANDIATKDRKSDGFESAIVIDEAWIFLGRRCFLARRLNGI
jgi:hypothetical protein